MKSLAAKSPRCKLFEYGKTHEGRTLYYLVIVSEANIARLDALKADYAKLADPRKVSKAEADRLADSAAVTRESIGAGQLILFAADPVFRAAALGTTRVFANAVVCGPGMGATQPIKP